MAPDVMGIIFDRPFMMGVYLVFLASLSIINMARPGHPVMLGTWVMVSDLRTGAFSGGGGEQALLGAAASQMLRYYGIPGGMGAGMTDSKLPDNQAGLN